MNNVGNFFRKFFTNKKIKYVLLKTTLPYPKPAMRNKLFALKTYSSGFLQNAIFTKYLGINFPHCNKYIDKY